jgi:hypothetical protein
VNHRQISDLTLRDEKLKAKSDIWLFATLKGCGYQSPLLSQA